MNLGTYLSRSAMYWPDEVAVACADRKWTFAGLESEANRLAAALIGRGLRPGDAVASLAWNRGELVVVEFALYKAGLLRVPVNARLGRGEVEHVLENSAARVVFVDADHADLVGDAAGRCQVVVLGADADADPVPGAPAYAELCAEAGTEAPVAVEVGEDDPCVLNYTSGSTGALKAATQTFGNRLANMRKQHMSDDSRPRPGTRYLACGPITHAGGMNLLAGVFGGAASHVLPHWGVEAFLDTVERERITDTFVVPAMLAMLLDHPDTRKRDLSSLASLRVGGAPISPARLRQAVEVFGPIVSQGYGLGETTSVVAGLSSEVIANAVKDDPELLASCGRAAFDSEIRVVGEDGADLPPRRVGEIIVRGPDCVPGYWGEPELSAEAFRDGWVYTGDLASLLDLHPEHTLADLCQNVAHMDRTMLERSLVRHDSGVRLLAPPRRFGDVSLITPQGVRQALSVARLLFPYLVVDLDRSFGPEQVQALRQADVILLVLRLHGLQHVDRGPELAGERHQRVLVVVAEAHVEVAIDEEHADEPPEGLDRHGELAARLRQPRQRDLGLEREPHGGGRVAHRAPIGVLGRRMPDADGATLPRRHADHAELLHAHARRRSLGAPRGPGGNRKTSESNGLTWGA